MYTKIIARIVDAASVSLFELLLPGYVCHNCKQCQQFSQGSQFVFVFVSGVVLLGCFLGVLVFVNVFGNVFWWISLVLIITLLGRSFTMFSKWHWPTAAVSLYLSLSFCWLAHVF